MYTFACKPIANVGCLAPLGTWNAKNNEHTKYACNYVLQLHQTVIIVQVYVAIKIFSVKACTWLAHVLA